MKKVVVIHQPDFLPWSGFFHRFLKADLYIALDHVQFVSGSSRSWTHRDRIKTAAGPRWLTLRTKKAPLGTSINAIELAPGRDWRDANLKQLHESYREAPHFSEIFGELEALYARNDTMLVGITLASIDMLERMLDVSRPRLLSSSLSPQGARNEMLADLLRKVGATHYLSGVGARAYFDPKSFAEAGIEVLWQQEGHPVYPQLHGEFVPYLSAVDMLFNCGIEQSREILRSS